MSLLSRYAVRDVPFPTDVRRRREHGVSGDAGGAVHELPEDPRERRDLRVAEVKELDLVITDGKVEAYRARLNVSFKFEDK